MKYLFNQINVFALVVLIFLCGCVHDDPRFHKNSKIDDPQFHENSKMYGIIYKEGNTVLHNSGNLSLYHYLPNGRRKILSSGLIEAYAFADSDLIVFNGFGSDDHSSQLYQALFGYTGSGLPVEISKPLTRKITLGNGPAVYAFTPSASMPNPNMITNGFISFFSHQILHIQDTNYPQFLILKLSAREIREVVEIGQTNGVRAKYGGVKFIIAN